MNDRDWFRPFRGCKAAMTQGRSREATWLKFKSMSSSQEVTRKWTKAVSS